MAAAPPRRLPRRHQTRPHTSSVTLKLKIVKSVKILHLPKSGSAREIRLLRARPGITPGKFVYGIQMTVIYLGRLAYDQLIRESFLLEVKHPAILP